MRLTDEELNGKIATLADSEAFMVRGLESSGKCVPYIGWFWRYVEDWSAVPLGTGDRPGEFDVPTYIGVMVNNKWDYPQWDSTPEQGARIRELLEEAVVNPSSNAFQAAYDYIQTCTAPVSHA
jgi:hypothetical protein